MAVDLVKKALAAKRESKHVEFKASFDPDSQHDWCETLKDIVAIANSGGGVLVVGVDNRGNPSKIPVTALLALDHAVLTDKIHQYTGVQFSEFQIKEGRKGRHRIGCLLIEASLIPLIFIKPGTYVEGASNKQRTAFGRGTIYFRHGAKSEPIERDDLLAVIDNNVETYRRRWMSGVKKIIQAPTDYRVHVLPAHLTISTDPAAQAVRIVDDPSAPMVAGLDIDRRYPFRQKELLNEVNKHLPLERRLNQFHILAVRRVHSLDSNERFCHKPRFSTAQYSEALRDWLLRQYEDNHDFFRDACQSYSQLHKGRS